MKILCCGDRNWQSMPIIENKLKQFTSDTIIIHGNARGADSLSGLVADNLGMKVIKFPANWSKFGRAAGPIRNQQMLDEGKPDLIIAFHNNIEESKDTRDMINRARLAGLDVEIITLWTK